MSSKQPVTIRNLTPHDVAVLAPGQPAVIFVAEGLVARLREVSGPPSPLSTTAGPVPIRAVRYEPHIDGLPDPVDGVRFLVSRVTAAASDRTDLLFPQDEIRDSAARIIGCGSLGYFDHGVGDA